MDLNNLAGDGEQRVKVGVFIRLDDKYAVAFRQGVEPGLLTPIFSPHEPQGEEADRLVPAYRRALNSVMRELRAEQARRNRPEW